MAHSYEQVLNAVTAASGVALALAMLTLFTTQGTPLCLLGLGLISILLVLVAVVCQYLRYLEPCDSLTWPGFLKLAMMKIISVTLARHAVWSLRRAYRSRSAMRAMQEKALMRIVKQSRDTVFGRDHRFAEVRGFEDFRAQVPVREYTELDKYNQLAYRGDPNVFFPGAVEFLNKTSGTTGKNKTIPGAKRFVRDMVFMYMTCLHCAAKFVTNSGRKNNLAPQLMVAVHPVDRKNEFGVPIGPASKFFGSHGDICTTPLVAFERIHDVKTAFYVHAVFALWHETIGDVNVFFPTSLITFMRCLGANWDSVLRDIGAGRLSADKLDVDAELLSLLNQRLRPKPERAAQLRALFGDGRDLTGFFEKAWPDAPFVMLARSGSFQSSYRYLKKYLGNLPTFGPLLGGTEGIVGINMTVKDVDYESPELYHPLLGPSFVEYVPVDSNGNDIGEPRLTHELEVGKLYETVVTSFNCFRLRTGDVIRVMKMDYCAPVFEISHRKSHVLTVHVEKTTEKSLQACVMLAAQRLGCQVVDFTAADCYLYEPVAGVSLGAKYYAMFVELDGDRRLTDDDKLVFDQALMECSENYALFRNDAHIDVMRVTQVRNGAFGALKQEMMAQNKDISEMQFKMPRVLRTDGLVKCILEQQI